MDNRETLEEAKQVDKMTRFAFQVGHLKTLRMMDLHKGKRSLFKNRELYVEEKVTDYLSHNGSEKVNVFEFSSGFFSCLN